MLQAFLWTAFLLLFEFVWNFFWELIGLQDTFLVKGLSTLYMLAEIGCLGS